MAYPFGENDPSYSGFDQPSLVNQFTIAANRASLYQDGMTGQTVDIDESDTGNILLLLLLLLLIFF